MFYVAKAKRQIQLFGYPLKEVKASGGCHWIGFVQTQSRFWT
ncbi:hypothetical protein [Lysinibacillus xylanilyticus]